jgi:putative protease
MIGHIPELIKAGITSFKLEGRIKGAFYAASVTKAYREAVDLYMEDPEHYSEDPRWQEMLDRTVHREFATGFYYDRPGENAQIFPDKTYHRPAFVVGVVTGYDEEKGCAIVSQRNKIFKGDTLHILTPDGYPEPIKAEEIFDENGDPIDSTPHAEMTYLLKVAEPLPAYTFLSRDGDKDEGIFKSGDQPAQTKP